MMQINAPSEYLGAIDDRQAAASSLRDSTFQGNKPTIATASSALGEPVRAFILDETDAAVGVPGHPRFEAELIEETFDGLNLDKNTLFLQHKLVQNVRG